MKQTKEELLSYEDVIRLTGKTEQTIRNWIGGGLFPAPCLRLGKNCYFSKTEFHNAMKRVSFFTPKATKDKLQGYFGGTTDGIGKGAFLDRKASADYTRQFNKPMNTPEEEDK